jgi:N-acetylmuramoyl-L-alanine amidase
MIRRNFIQLLPSVLTGLISFPVSLLAKFLNLQDTDYTITIKNLITGAKPKKIRYKKFYNQLYISLIEFSTANDYRTYTNSSKRKTVLYLDRDKIKFTADNGFILLNDQLYNYPYEPVWVEGEIWICARILAELFNENTIHKMSFDEINREFVIGKKEVNISNINISSKDNGTLIHFYSDKEFTEKEISLKITNNWFYIDIYGAKVDSEALAARETAGIISEIQVIPFEQSVSFAFKLTKSVESKELIFSEDSNDFFVNLRTTETQARDEKARDDLEKQKEAWMVDTIIIDAGHGGKDPGAIGHGKVKEKDIVLPIALKLGEIIKKKLPDVKVIYTRDRDIFIPLWKRTKIANENNGKLFVSLHCNSNNSSRVAGFETYFLSSDKDDKARDVVLTENESIRFESSDDQKRYEGINFVLATLAQNAFLKYSQYFASLVQKSLNTKLASLGMKDRGVKQGPFWVMVGATMPNILIELGFISNNYEAKLLKQKATQNKIADAICNGIVKYKNDFENAL